MPFVAEALRAETLRALAGRSADERVTLALELGDEDLRLLVAYRHISEGNARRLLTCQRQHGRARSACHEALNR